MANKKTAITPQRSQDFAAWYQQVIMAADLAEHSSSRGSMVIKPWGYGIWEIIQKQLDQRFKDTGHENAYFPLLIPIKLLEKEASHIDGFAQECAVVTHSRLTSTQEGKLAPASPLEEPYVVRPTSEAIIGETYAKWVHSYRDLPILINQWANVVRWEMRTRFFVRTSEFLWQEGHTVHATAEEAQEETTAMLSLYSDFVSDYLAIPTISGTKTPDERFPGAVETYCIEALMQDGKALQAGTSHFLGQIFAKAYNIRFQNQQGEQQHAWTTSWGVSTRLIGGMIMTHSDDDGLVLPPKVAPKHIVIQPILRNTNQDKDILKYCHILKESLSSLHYAKEPLRVHVDQRSIRPGEKNWQHIKRGVPIRIEIGPKELKEQTVSFARRDNRTHTKTTLPQAAFLRAITEELSALHTYLIDKARTFLSTHLHSFHSLEETENFLASGGKGFIYLPWCKDAIGHEFLAKHKLSPRCIPLKPQNIPHQHNPDAKCAFSHQKASHSVLFAKAY
ncbi:MAG: proline--tRNA ligase [Proteobacteria bacterium]|nr:proline--tRNA ligase [Pseudomonadota bacterium]